MYTEVVEYDQWAKAHFFIGPSYSNDRMPDLTRQAIIAKITEIAGHAGDAAGIEVVEVQVQGAGKARLVRIYIDKPEGVSHTDCEWISKRVGDVLDAEDIVPGESYTLEVSSPGVERRLSRPKDFERFAGQKARIVLREPIENRKSWEGKLAGYEDGMIALEPAQGERIQVPLAQVEKANLKFEW